MIVVEVLLAANLAVFAVLAIRSPRVLRPRMDDLVAMALRSMDDPPAVTPEYSDNVVPLRSRQDRQLAMARAAHHPSALSDTSSGWPPH